MTLQQRIEQGEQMEMVLRGSLRGAAGDVLYRPEPPTGFVLEAFLCRVVLKWRFRWPLEVNHLSQASHWYKKVWSLTQSPVFDGVLVSL